MYCNVLMLIPSKFSWCCEELHHLLKLPRLLVFSSLSTSAIIFSLFSCICILQAFPFLFYLLHYSTQTMAMVKSLWEKVTSLCTWKTLKWNETHHWIPFALQLHSITFLFYRDFCSHCRVCHKVICVQTPTRPAALHSSCLASSLSSYFFPAV